MGVLSLEINDAELTVAQAGGVLAVEHGYALVEDGGIITGREAYGAARLKPRQSYSRFWSDLAMEPMKDGPAGVGSTAELAFAQLKRVWEQHGGDGSEAVLVIPGYYNKNQLGLLLGLAQECGIRVRGLVNAAVAASLQPFPGHQLVYVDAGLHRVVLSRLVQTEHVTLAEETTLDSVGLDDVLDIWARRVAELFISQTRFDPFHRADTEQALYDRLPGWIRQVAAEGSAELVLPANGSSHSVALAARELLAPVSGFYRAVVQLVSAARNPGAPLVIQLSHRLAQLPGLVERLGTLEDAHVIALEPGLAATGVLESLGDIKPRGEHITLLKRLAWRREPGVIDKSVESAQGNDAAEVPVPLATHVVYQGLAHPVTDAPFMIGREVAPGHGLRLVNGHSGVSREHCQLSRQGGELQLSDSSRHGTFVNEKRIAGQALLVPGDVIRIGSPGEQLQVIALADSEHGA
jgi:pSer/pThr/pTyr-binding forkhead associated (FHA) protein